MFLHHHNGVQGISAFSTDKYLQAMLKMLEKSTKQSLIIKLLLIIIVDYY